MSVIDIDKIVASVKANNDAYQSLVGELRRVNAENASLREAVSDRRAADAVEQIVAHLDSMTADIQAEIAALAQQNSAAG